MYHTTVVVESVVVELASIPCISNKFGTGADMLDKRLHTHNRGNDNNNNKNDPGSFPAL